jgi:hypothetical protein
MALEVQAWRPASADGLLAGRALGGVGYQRVLSASSSYKATSIQLRESVLMTLS